MFTVYCCAALQWPGVTARTWKYQVPSPCAPDVNGAAALARRVRRRAGDLVELVGVAVDAGAGVGRRPGEGRVVVRVPGRLRAGWVDDETPVMLGAPVSTRTARCAGEPQMPPELTPRTWKYQTPSPPAVPRRRAGGLGDRVGRRVGDLVERVRVGDDEVGGVERRPGEVDVVSSYQVVESGCVDDMRLVISGPPASMRTRRCCVALQLPAASRARTWKYHWPSLRPEYARDVARALAHRVEVVSATWSIDVRVAGDRRGRVARRPVEGRVGARVPRRLDGMGRGGDRRRAGAPSRCGSSCAAPRPTAPSASTARTWKYQTPSASAAVGGRRPGAFADRVGAWCPRPGRARYE